MSPKFSEKLEISPSANDTSVIILNPIDTENSETTCITLGGTYSHKLPDGKAVPGAMNGDVIIKNKNNIRVIQLWGKTNSILIRNNNDLISILIDGQSGNMKFNTTRGETISLLSQSADIKLGGNGQAGDIFLMNSTGKETIHLNGNSGDIILENADCAEEFDIAGDEDIEPGTVVIFDDQGRLRESTEAYDGRVAGVVSGGGDIKPGIILGRQTGRKTRLPLALIGKVLCKVDAQYAPISPGDMLTTSLTPGFAMKVDDVSRAFGAIIGKALRPLASGKGAIPIIVSLQ